MKKRKRIKIEKLKCKRCGHEWVARKDYVITCSKCRSPYWDRERKSEKKEGE